MREPISALMLDMDGVLVDSSSVHARAYTETFAEWGVDFALERFEREFAGVPRAEVIATIMGEATESERAHAFARKAHWVHRILEEGGAPAHVGAGTLLERARAADCPVVLVTTSLTPEAFLSAHAWSEAIDLIVSGRDVTHHKPHPQPYLLAAERVGVAPSTCAAIEDSPRGVRSAHDAGYHTFSVTTTHSEHDLLDAGAHKVCSDLLTIVELLFLRRTE